VSYPSHTGATVFNTANYTAIYFDQVLELSWNEDLNSTPTIQYLPVTCPVAPSATTSQPEGNLQQIQQPTIAESGLADTSTHNKDNLWRPIISTNGSEPDWVVYRNQVLQDLLDEAAPLFVIGADIGTPMCEVCREHFASLKLDVSNTWSKEEIDQDRERRQHLQPN
jgi:hypothetical protein